MHSKHPDVYASDSAASNANGDASNVVFTPHEVRAYVARARTFRPTVPDTVTEYLTKTYVRLRKAQKVAESKGQNFAHTTPRTLLGVVRLAQALARLRFADVVIQEDVDEALRLVEASKESLTAHEGPRRRGRDANTRIMEEVKRLLDSGACRPDDEDDDDEEDGSIELSMRKVRERVLAKGFTEDQWLTALDEYTSLDVSPTARPRRRGELLLTFVTRSGKLRAMAQGWCSSTLVTAMTRTWSDFGYDGPWTRPRGFPSG